MISPCSYYIHCKNFATLYQQHATNPVKQTCWAPFKLPCIIQVSLMLSQTRALKE